MQGLTRDSAELCQMILKPLQLCVVLLLVLVQAAGGDGAWLWRTNLAASSPYWRGWYEGLSDAFLALTVPKMLLLAGTDR